MGNESRSDRFFRWLSWRLPQQLVYFATIRLIAYATNGTYSDTVVPELKGMEALGRWEQKANTY